MEDEYRAYREVMAAGIKLLRPKSEVSTAGLDTLQEEMASLDPQFVVCSRPEPTYAEGVHTWVELPVDPTQPMKVRHGGHRLESSGSTLEALLMAIDEAQAIARTEESPGGKRP